jgi:hypothetical protein
MKNVKFLVIGPSIGSSAIWKVLSDQEISAAYVEIDEKLGISSPPEALFRLHNEDSLELMRSIYPGVELLSATNPGFQDASEGRERGMSKEKSDQFMEQPYFYAPDSLFRSEQSKPSLKASLPRFCFEEKTVSFEESIQYERLVWGLNIESLNFFFDKKLPVPRPSKELTWGGLTVDWTIPYSEAQLPSKVSFRVGELRLNAYGSFYRLADQYQCSWTVLLDEERTGHSEWLAKCISSLKREVLKKLELSDRALVGHEKILFHKQLVELKPTAVPSLELCDGIDYIGSEFRIQDDKSGAVGADLSLRNLRTWLETQGIPIGKT